MRAHSRIIVLAAVMALLSCLPALAANHPAYLHALEDLRAARWMLQHRPGNWAQTADEAEAVNQIDQAINEIKLASIDDGKDIDFRPKVDEKPDHIGRLHDALEYLNRAHAEVTREEDNLFAKGLRGRAAQHIDAALAATKNAIESPERPAQAQGGHPAYLHALSDLRAARWLIEHRPGDWARTAEEAEAVRQIDAAIKDIKIASIDDGKNIDDHPAVDERPDHVGRLHDALDFLGKARADIGQDEDNAFAQGLRGRAFAEIDAAIRSVRIAIKI
jgi:tetratricopeptide (TPR) repeat protein